MKSAIRSFGTTPCMGALHNVDESSGTHIGCSSISRYRSIERRCYEMGYQSVGLSVGLSDGIADRLIIK